MYKQNIKPNLPERRRGRPVGKNRVPLTLEERRARNAQYERERRITAADAMVQLAEAAGCETSIPNADLLATVINKIQRAAERGESENIEEIKRCNDNLMAQILKLEQELLKIPGVDLTELEALSDDVDETPVQHKPKKRKIIKEEDSNWEEQKKHRKEKQRTQSSELKPPIKSEESEPLQFDQTSNSFKPELHYSPNPEPQNTSNWPTPPEPTSELQFQPVQYSNMEAQFHWSLERSHYEPDRQCWEYPLNMQNIAQENTYDKRLSSLLSESPTQSSESECQTQSPVDLDSILGVLTEEEKTLLSGVVQQIDSSTTYNFT